MIAQVVLGIGASMIVMWFSRHREFRADAAGAQLAGRDNMIGALERLKAPSQNAGYDAGYARRVWYFERRAAGIRRRCLRHTRRWTSGSRRCVRA